jgi:transposase-like protein
MEFPIVALLGEEECEQWVEQYFHPGGLRCPQCGGLRSEWGGRFRRNLRSHTTVWRCRRCGQTYSVYSGTLFYRHQLTCPQVVLLVRGVLQGQSSRALAAELGLSRQTVHDLRRTLQARAIGQQPTTPLPDRVVEADEAFVNAGEKRRAACLPG